MKQLKQLQNRFFLIAVYFLGTVMSAVAEVSVNQVRALQRSATNLVDVNYNLSGADSPTEIKLSISADGGKNFNVPAKTLTGAVGLGILPGNNLKITWNAGVDWAGKFSTKMRFKIEAIEKVQDQAVAWDISDHSNLFGKINMDLQNRFIVSEIIDKFEDNVVRRNAGIHVIDPNSGHSSLLLIDKLGFPSLLCIDDDFVIEFLNADLANMQVTWQLSDRDGKILQSSTTTTVSAKFFAMATASATLANQSLLFAPIDENSPSLDKSLLDVGLYASDFVTNSADLLISDATSMKKSTAFLGKSLLSTIGFVEGLSDKKSTFLSASLWAYNTAECAMFVGAVIGATATAPIPPVSAAKWLVVTARATSGLSACAESGKGVLDTMKKLSAKDQAEQVKDLIYNANYIRFYAKNGKNDLRFVDTTYDSYIYETTLDYLVAINPAVVMLRRASEIINLMPPASENRTKLKSDLLFLKGVFIDDAETRISGAQKNADAISTVEIPELNRQFEICKKQPWRAADIPYFEAKIRDLPIRRDAWLSLIQPNRLLLNNINDSF